MGKKNKNILLLNILPQILKTVNLFNHYGTGIFFLYLNY